jgi:hypothetical protein
LCTLYNEAAPTAWQFLVALEEYTTNLSYSRTLHILPWNEGPQQSVAGHQLPRPVSPIEAAQAFNRRALASRGLHAFRRQCWSETVVSIRRTGREVGMTGKTAPE